MHWDFRNPFTVRAVPQAGEIDGLQHTNNAAHAI